MSVSNDNRLNGAVPPTNLTATSSLYRSSSIPYVGGSQALAFPCCYPVRQGLWMHPSRHLHASPSWASIFSMRLLWAASSRRITTVFQIWTNKESNSYLAYPRRMYRPPPPEKAPTLPPSTYIPSRRDTASSAHLYRVCP